MIKIVRISSILIALLVVIILALPVVLGANNGGTKDKESYEVQSVVERFKKTRGERAKKDTDQKPPLVKEAEDFALYLNPPKPPVRTKQPTAVRKEPAVPSPPQSVRQTPKFNLIATCVHESNPALSVALIDAPGGDRRWVRQSDVVGHLIIKEIKEGSVTINDGTRNYPLDMAARPVETSLVVGNSIPGESKRPTNHTLILNNNTGLDKTTLNKRQVPSTKSSGTTIRDEELFIATTPEEQKLLDKFMEEIDSIMAEPAYDEASLEQSFSKTDALMDKYFSELENMRVSRKEAQKLDDLGKKLDSEKKDPNQPKIERPPAGSRRRPPVLR